MSRNPVPLISISRAIDRDIEIDRIKRELEFFRARYSWYCRIAVVIKVFFTISFALISIGASVLAVKLVRSDALSGAFFVIILLVAVLLIIVWVRNSRLRWIDLASAQFHGALSYPFIFYPDRRRRPPLRSYAEFLEEQIAGREQRLSELINDALRTHKTDC